MDDKNSSVLPEVLDIVLNADLHEQESPPLLAAALALVHALWKGTHGRHHTRLVQAMKLTCIADFWQRYIIFIICCRYCCCFWASPPSFLSLTLPSQPICQRTTYIASYHHTPASSVCEVLHFDCNHPFLLSKRHVCSPKVGQAAHDSPSAQWPSAGVFIVIIQL